MPLNYTPIPLGTDKKKAEKSIFNGFDKPKREELSEEYGENLKDLINESRCVFHYVDGNQVLGFFAAEFSRASHYLEMHHVLSTPKRLLSLTDLFKRWCYRDYYPVQIDLDDIKNPVYGLLLHVFKDHRGNGVGSKIMKDVKPMFKEFGCDALILESENRAVKFYQSFVFEPMLYNNEGSAFMISRL